MGLLVDDLLLLARLDQTRPPRVETVDLAAVAADAVHDARAVDPGRSIELETTGATEVGGDLAQLRQVAANLLDNALRHTPAGTPVRIGVTGDETTVTLAVADDGPGLTPDQVQRVFEPFYRADPSRSRTSGGSGLGLAIAAAIVHAHGGALTVDSAPGAGATFIARLPRAIDQGALEPAPADSAETA
jgi:signal transduction histidine kinase